MIICRGAGRILVRLGSPDLLWRHTRAANATINPMNSLPRRNILRSFVAGSLLMPGIVQSLLMDGSVRSISENINLGTWRALGTRNGKEVVGEF